MPRVKQEQESTHSRLQPKYSKCPSLSDGPENLLRNKSCSLAKHTLNDRALHVSYISLYHVLVYSFGFFVHYIKLDPKSAARKKH